MTFCCRRLNSKTNELTFVYLRILICDLQGKWKHWFLWAFLLFSQCPCELFHATAPRIQNFGNLVGPLCLGVNEGSVLTPDTKIVVAWVYILSCLEG